MAVWRVWFSGSLVWDRVYKLYGYVLLWREYFLGSLVWDRVYKLYGYVPLWRVWFSGSLVWDRDKSIERGFSSYVLVIKKSSLTFNHGTLKTVMTILGGIITE